MPFAGGNLGTLYIRLGADNVQLIKGIQQSVLMVTGGAGQMSASIKSLTAAFAGANVATSLFNSAIQATAAVVKDALDVFIDFDKQLTTSLSIMGDVSPKLRAELEATARTIATNSSTSAVKLASAYYNLASAGLDVKQSQQALGVVEQFARGNVIELTKSIDLLTGSQAALGLKSKDPQANMENMIRLGDMLTKVNQLAIGTTEDFANALANNAGAAMRQFNIPVEQGLAVLASFAEQGVKGRVAGERFAIMLRDLQRAALDNSGEFERLGIHVFDSNFNLRNMSDVVGDLEKAFAGLSSGEKQHQLDLLSIDQRAGKAILTLLGTSKAIADYEEKLKVAGGTTRDVADKQMQALQSQLDEVKNRFTDLLLIVGESGLRPALTAMLTILKDLTDQNSDLAKSVKELSDVFGPLLKNFLVFQATIVGIGAKAAAAAPNFLIGMFPQLKALDLLTGGKGVKALNDFGDSVLKTTAKIASGSSSAATTTETSANKIVSSFNLVNKATDHSREIIEANSKRITDALDRMGAPKLEIDERTGFLKRDAQGKLTGMSQTDMNIAVFGEGGQFSNKDLVDQLQFKKEQDLLNERLKYLKDFYQKEGLLNEESQKRKLQTIELYNRQLKQLQMAQLDASLTTASKMFGDLSTIAEAFGGKQTALYKSMFAASKAFAIAESTVKIFQGIAEAAAAPWPLNLAAIASVVAATANIVSSIQSTKLEFAGERAMGGPVSAGKMYLVGEKGPEPFIPSVDGTIIPNDKMGGGNVTVQVHNYTDAQATVTQREDGNQKVIDVVMRRIKRDLSGEIREGRGDVSKALESTFSLRRGGGR